MVLRENFPSEKSASENSKTNIVPWKALINSALSFVNVQIFNGGQFCIFSESDT
jgi:hypothetical protein